MKQHQNQQRPRVPASEFAQKGQSRDIENSLAPDHLGLMVHIGLVVCLVTLLLGTSVFVISGAAGGAIGHYLGYVGGAFRRFTLYLSIPLWLAAWVCASSPRNGRVRFDWSRLLPCLLFAFYVLMQLLVADPVWAEASFERLFAAASIVLLALPLCYRKGCNLFWMGMVVAGVVFFMSLLFSGQLLSALRGEGFQGMTKETSARLNLGMDTITSASMMYQCVLAGVFWLVANPKKVYFWLVGIPVCAALCATAILTGSKGPALAFGTALLTIFFAKGFKRNINVLLAVGMVAAALWKGQEVLSYYTGSVRHLGVGLGDEARLWFYKFVIESVPTLFGNGIGSWSVDIGFGPGGYVHNSLLEAYYEMGLVGAGLFLWAVGAVGLTLLRDVRKHRDPVAGFVLAYFIYGLAFSMVSGSIFNDTELLLGLVLGCTRFNTLAQTVSPHTRCFRHAPVSPAVWLSPAASCVKSKTTTVFTVSGTSP